MTAANAEVNARPARQAPSLRVEEPLFIWWALAGAFVMHAIMVSGLLVLERFTQHERIRPAEIAEVDLVEPPPPPPPPPPQAEPPPPPPQPTAPPPEPVRVHHDTPPPPQPNTPPPPPPPPSAPPPLMVADEQSNEPGGDSVPTGNNTNFQGGDMHANGVANQGPVHNAVVGGTPGGTGTGPSQPPQEDLSEQAHISIDSDALSAYYPAEAQEQGISNVRVCVRLTVDADGHITAAHATADPGHGFARAAERAALNACSAEPARNRAGQAVTTSRQFCFTFTMD